MINYFKKYIMSVVKILGLYQDIPYYKLKSLYLILVILLPFTPTFIYSRKESNTSSSITLLFFLFTYILITVIIGNYLAKVGKKWKQNEYDKLNIELVVLRFLFIQAIYAICVFLSFYAIIKINA